jgi:hypothetical protein
MNQPSETRAGRIAAGARAEPAGRTDSARHLDPAPMEPIGGRSPRDLPCHVHDPDLWFADSPADLERAKELCATCPVRLECGAANRAGCGVARSCGTAKCCRSREAAAGHGFTSQLPATQIVLANTPDRLPRDQGRAQRQPRTQRRAHRRGSARSVLRIRLRRRPARDDGLPQQPTCGRVRTSDGHPQTPGLERARLLPSLTLQGH